PTLGYRIDCGGFFFEPKVSLRFTDYRLSGRDTSAERNLSRTVPMVSADAGLIFERRLANGHLQTLEPRFFYGYVPYRDQDAIPLFDTVDREFSFDSLFSTRRFSGSDRVGDTQQITTALTSRIVDPTSGQEKLSVSAGQI
ncbi:LPS assembly protein LptD, partial [Arthrospira platensis SPKY2]